MDTQENHKQSDKENNQIKDSSSRVIPSTKEENTSKEEKERQRKKEARHEIRE